MDDTISIVSCSDYTPITAAAALAAALAPIGGLNWVMPGMRIGIKVNLLRKAKPESATVTHPVLVTELCRMLVNRGAHPIVGDSPGGPWNGPFVSAIYAASGMKLVETAGGQLNYDFSIREVENPRGKMIKRFRYTAWLDDVDAVIDFAKLKTHALTTMTCAVKNFYGLLPGTRKVEFHYRFPKVEDFSNMLLDLNEYIRPKLTLVDAVDAMEGNGPAHGTPRRIGALIAANDPYSADLLCAHLIGLPNASVPTVQAAIARGLCPASVSELKLFGDPARFAVQDFKNLPPQNSTLFCSSSKLKQTLAKRLFGTHPKVIQQDCTGCGLCTEVCPVGAITVKEKTASVDSKQCIRCFCCQELCPSGAVAVHRTVIARFLTK
ncbi:MAG: DUF362 domain-containing protein [Oscillospiraceae bacterium]|jgi:uncharacterized protein (DUF362 family)/NAD-dependent dihydropyrimidine dehydrogenase PreA subunit